MGYYSHHLTLPDYLDKECGQILDMTMRYEADFRQNHRFLMTARERVVFGFNQEADQMVIAERIEGLLVKMQAKVIHKDRCGTLWSAEVPAIARDRNDQRRADRRGMFAHEVMGEARGSRWEKQPNFLVVEVINSTAEPDGTFNHYFLPVHPELRPIPDPEVMEKNSKTQQNPMMVGWDMAASPANAISINDLARMRKSLGSMDQPWFVNHDPNEGYGPVQELTARNAVASTFGLIGPEYHPTIET